MNSIKTGFLTGEQNKALISVRELMIGMYVCELDRPWEETSFIFQGFLIEDQNMLQLVKDQCEYVFIDIIKQNNALPIMVTRALVNKNKKPLKKAKPLIAKENGFEKNLQKKRPGLFRLKDILDDKQSINKINPPPKQVIFEQEINHAQQVHSKTSRVVKNFLQQISNGRKIEIALAKQAVYECMRSILRNPDAMMLMTQLRYKDKYTWSHSMNVCILAISFARHLNLRYEELITLGLCGMLHDMGKMKIPADILNKAGKLDEHEQKIMQSHTTLGMEVLSATPGMAKIIADVAHSHHERLDGKGFPRGLRGKQISPYAKMISIIDIYDAMTTDRVNQQSRTHLDALNVLIDMSETQIDQTLVNRFIQCIGIYPPGCIVEMNSGEIAIVLEVNEMKKLRPKILIISDKNKKQCAKRVINLSDKQFDAERNFHSIKTIIRPESYGIDAAKYYKYGIIQKELISG